MMPPAKPRAFRSVREFRAWLARHHATHDEIILRLYKTAHSHHGMTYAQALDEALCYGWIDGVLSSLDDVSFIRRFTPRKPRSIWSRVNVRKVEALIETGRMAKPGLDAYAKRTADRTGIYAFERAALKLSPAFLKKFKANRAAWAYFQSQPPWYQRLMVFRVMSAKRPETRLRRLDQTIAHSAAGEWVPGFPERSTPKAK
jgi:uncharacterized protein YdeI (YjbR/CyaY-like superfamily)